MNGNTADFEIFAKVARTGNMSAAGREMSLSPAVISKRIAVLEDRLGAKLFQRTTRQLTLTEIGEGFYKRVVDILSLVEEAEDFVNRTNNIAHGSIKIACYPEIYDKYIFARLPLFLDSYPGLKLEFDLSDVPADIIAGGYDLGIRIGERPDASLASINLMTIEKILCASQGYIADNDEITSVEDLQYHNCISKIGEESWELEGPEGRRSVRIRGNLSVSSASAAASAIRAGIGVGFLSADEFVADGEGQVVRVLEGYREASNRGVFAICPYKQFMPTKIKYFIDFLGQCFGSNESDLWKTLIGDEMAGDEDAGQRAAVG